MQRAISIHLMLLFNNTSVPVYGQDFTISIHLMLLFNLQVKHFRAGKSYFNTSNVTIQLILLRFLLWGVINFNTSNVTIQL